MEEVYLIPGSGWCWTCEYNYRINQTKKCTAYSYSKYRRMDLVLDQVLFMYSASGRQARNCTYIVPGIQSTVNKDSNKAVLRIHDILGWIRIRGSMPLTNGSGFGSGSCYFCHWPSRCQQKTNFLTQFFLLITFRSYIYIIFQR